MSMPVLITEVGTALVTYGIPIAAKALRKHAGEYHGSRVIMGAHKGCRITMFGKQACIIVDEEKGGYIKLTSDTIQSLEFVKKEKKMVGLSQDTYYYYTIVFKDGSESYVWMRRPYREAMKQYTKCE